MADHCSACRLLHSAVLSAALSLLLAGCLSGSPPPATSAAPPAGSAPAAIPRAAEAPAPGDDLARISAAQPALIAAALDRVAAGVPGRTELYFVGFAGDAREDVFLHEATAARDLVDRRFGSAGRSLLLANNAATVDALPLASLYNLSRVLAAVGARMNREEDVLFLFLTSHGAEGGWLSTNFASFRPRAFVARQLDAALDDAGIKWRVVVVSACFSGGFIEPLADVHSLIITAARADRASFGCGHDGQFTYFGDAYFGRALPAARSFADAFDVAKAQVASWEAAKNFRQSLPQIHVGAAVEAKLAEIEAQASAAN